MNVRSGSLVLLLALLLAQLGCGRGAPPVSGPASPAPASPGASPGAPTVDAAQVAELDRLRAAAEQDPKDPTALLAYATALIAAGRDGEAQTILDRVLAIDARNVEALRLKEQVAKNSGDRAAVIDAAKKRLEVQPDDLGAQETLAWEYGFVMAPKAATPAEKEDLLRQSLAMYEKLLASQSKAGGPVDILTFRVAQVHHELFKATSAPKEKEEALKGYRDYLTRFPTGQLIVPARAALAELEK